MAPRFSFALALLALVLFVAMRPSGPVLAGPAFTVTVVPRENPVPVGGEAVFDVRIQGDTLHVPTFDFEVAGGTLSGVAALNPTAADLAEGAVFVTRDSAGTATLTVRLGGESLAASSASFAPVGTIAIAFHLDAAADAAARTWRYEVVAASGEVVESLSVSASGDAPSAVVETHPLPLGAYVVRQVWGADLQTTCLGGAFYQLVSPLSGEYEVSLEFATETVGFTVRPCSSSVSNGAASEDGPAAAVHGARQPGPESPLPPRTGDSPLANAPNRANGLFLLFAGAIVTLLAPVVWATTRRPVRS